MKLRREPRCSAKRQSGFSIVELVIVCVIGLVLAALAIPQILSMVHTYRLRNAVSEFESIVQQARSRAVRDSSFYPVQYVETTPITEAFVSLDRSSNLVTTCSSDANCDPVVSWSAEVQPYAFNSTGVPSTSALKTLVLAGTSSGNVAFLDGFTLGPTPGTTPITFSPEGLPCVANSTSSPTICNSATTQTVQGSGVVVAYWVFFQDNANGQWMAVTVTPAGKIQKWYYSGSWKQI